MGAQGLHTPFATERHANLVEKAGDVDHPSAPASRFEDCLHL